eukprot:jgi/Botrbrau1/4023/Bobra.0016s0030.1
MVSHETLLQQWTSVFADIPSTCGIEVQVHKLLCCLFVAETVEDEDSVKTFSTAMSKSHITGAVLGSANQLWTHLGFEGPIKKFMVKGAVRLFLKRWKASKVDFVMQGCPGSDTLPGLVLSAYSHMRKAGVGWVDMSQGMAWSICKMWTSQALCVSALQSKFGYLPSSPAAMSECVKTVVWVYMNMTTLPAAIVTTIFNNVSNIAFTCENVIQACIFMANEATPGCMLPDISAIANQFQQGLHASEEIPGAAQHMMHETVAVNVVDFVWKSCSFILQHVQHPSCLFACSHARTSFYACSFPFVVFPLVLVFQLFVVADLQF